MRRAMLMILVTGGLGFIGAYLGRELLRRGYDVVLLDIGGDESLIRDIKDRVNVVKGDVTAPAQFVEALRKYDVECIVHYAALLSNAAETNPQLAYEVNFNGLWNVFEAARIMGVKALIFASSIAAYGPNTPQTAREDVYTVPNTLYGVSKQLGEMLGLWFNSRYGIDFTALRYGTVVGPGRRDGGASAYCTLIIQKPAQGEPYEVDVAEDSAIPILYVKDAVDATVTAYEKIKGLKSRIYNLTSLSPSPKARELMDAVKRRIPSAEVTFKPDARVTAIVNSWPRDLDMSRARNELGWWPKYRSLDLLVGDFVNEVGQRPDMYRI